jgi:hypothetical protein
LRRAELVVSGVAIATRRHEPAADPCFEGPSTILIGGSASSKSKALKKAS